MQSAGKLGWFKSNEDVMHVLTEDKGTTKIFNEATKSGEAPGNSCKIHFLGDARAGKTSLCKKLRGERFDPDEKPTFGIDTKMCKVNEVDSVSWQDRNDEGSSEFREAVGWFLAKTISNQSSQESNDDAESKKIISTTSFVILVSLVAYSILFCVSKIMLTTLEIQWTYLFFLIIATSAHLFTDTFFVYRQGCEAAWGILTLYMVEQLTDDETVEKYPWDAVWASIAVFLWGIFMNAVNSLGFRTILIIFGCIWIDYFNLPSSQCDLCKGWYIALLYFSAWFSGIIYKPMNNLVEMLNPEWFKVATKYSLLDITIFTFSCMCVLSYPRKSVIYSVFGLAWRIGGKVGIKRAQQTGFLTFDSKPAIHGNKICLIFAIAFFIYRLINSRSVTCLCSVVMLLFVAIIELRTHKKVFSNPIPVVDVCKRLCRAAVYDAHAMNLSLKLSLWDFAGQEFFYNTHHTFMAQHAIYLLIFDLTRFKNKSGRIYEFQRIQFWLHSIRSHTDSPAILVATHLDQMAEETVHEIQSFFSSKLDYFIVKHKCKIFYNRQSPFFTVDNTENHSGHKCQDDLDDLRSALKKVSQAIDSMHNTYPIRWRTFLQLVQETRESVYRGDQPYSKLIISFSFLKDQYKEYSVQELKEMLSFFNDTGEIIFDAVDTILRQYVVLDPQYLVDIMQALTIGKDGSDPFQEMMPYRNLLNNRGILYKYLARKILNVNDDQFLDLILRFLQAKDLICDVTHISNCHSLNDQVFLVPSLLPLGSNNLPPNWDRKFFFDFGDHLPNAVFSRLLSRCAAHSDIPLNETDDDPTIFKDGGIFSYGPRFVYRLIVFNPSPDQFVLEVAIKAVPDSYPIDLLQTLWQIMQALRHRDFPKLEFTCGVFCPHPPPHPGCHEPTMMHIIPLASHASGIPEENTVNRLCYNRLVQIQLRLDTCNDDHRTSSLTIPKGRTRGRDDKLSKYDAVICTYGNSPSSITRQRSTEKQRDQNGNLTSLVGEVFVSCSQKDDSWVRENIVRHLSSQPNSIDIKFNQYDDVGQPDHTINVKQVICCPVFLPICTRHYESDVTERLRYERELAYKHKLQVIPV